MSRLKENLQDVLNYMLPDETKHFEEDFDLKLPEDTNEAIVFIEERQLTHHIVYNLLVLQQISETI
jgi:hypothetical protein